MQCIALLISKERSMRILVVGAGATGGLFGGLLAKAGRDVTFLVRANRAAQLRASGLQVKSPNGDFTIVPQIVVAGEIQAPFDLILLGLKAYALEGAIDDFAPAVGPNTMILPVLNGMRHIDLLVERFGEEPVLGGVCIVASMLDELGHIVQLNEMQELIYGERLGKITPRIEELDALMQGAGFGARKSEHIMRDMWEKWVFLASLAASTCLLRGSIGTIVGALGKPTISAIFDECVAVARAAGYTPSEQFLLATRARLTQAGSPLTASMYRDMQAGNPVEANAILGDLIVRARTFNLETPIDTPLLMAAFVALTVYERGRTQQA
jgi:2-dehydropantoate 2-reductase